MTMLSLKNLLEKIRKSYSNKREMEIYNLKNSLPMHVQGNASSEFKDFLSF